MKNHSDPIQQVKQAEERAAARIQTAHEKLAKAARTEEEARVEALEKIRRQYGDKELIIEGEARQDLKSFFEKLQTQTESTNDMITKKANSAMPKLVKDAAQRLANMA